MYIDLMLHATLDFLTKLMLLLKATLVLSNHGILHNFDHHEKAISTTVLHH